MEFTDSLSINAPMEHVRAAGLDLAAATQWMQGVVRIERLDDGPLRVGSQ